MFLNGAEGDSVNELLWAWDSCVAVWEGTWLAGVIFLPQGPGAAGNWMCALLTWGEDEHCSLQRLAGFPSESSWLASSLVSVPRDTAC